MPDITKSELQHWREVCEKATPGPWRVDKSDSPRANGEPRVDGIDGPEHTVDYGMGPEIESQRIVETDSGVYGPCWPDAQFIALARTALPRAIERIEELERENERLRTTRNRVWQREQEHLESRISTLERLCREAMETVAAWEAPDNPENMRLALTRISAILAAVEGES